MAKEYRIPVVWQQMGFYYVEADSLKDALEKIAKTGCPLPDNGEYLEDSFEIDWEGLEDYQDEVDNLTSR